MNKTILIGRLTKDPETKTTANSQVTNITLAVDRNFKNANGEKEADFIPVVAWGKTSEILDKYTAKGKQIAVFGRIQTRNYEDKDGRRVYVTEVVADEVQLLGSKSEQDLNKSDLVPMDGFEEIDLDLPFV